MYFSLFFLSNLWKTVKLGVTGLCIYSVISLSFIALMMRYFGFLQGAFVDQHFDQDLHFHATEEDPVTKKVGFMHSSSVMHRSTFLNI